LLPTAAAAGRAPAGSTDGTVVLFQGDSITDAGRDRGVADPNSASALGSGYPLLVAAAALAAHPDRGLRFYNRGISGNKVPDLAARWAADTVALAPGGRERRSSRSSGCSTTWRAAAPRNTGPPMASTPRRPATPPSRSSGVARRSSDLLPVRAFTLGLLTFAARLAAQDAPLQAFRDNIAAIHARDRAAYLSHYL